MAGSRVLPATDDGVSEGASSRLARKPAAASAPWTVLPSGRGAPSADSTSTAGARFRALRTTLTRLERDDCVRDGCTSDAKRATLVVVEREGSEHGIGGRRAPMFGCRFAGATGTIARKQMKGWALWCPMYDTIMTPTDTLACIETETSEKKTRATKHFNNPEQTNHRVPKAQRPPGGRGWRPEVCPKRLTRASSCVIEWCAVAQNDDQISKL